MAIVKNNIITQSLRGRIGNLVFRQRDGKTVVYSLPRAYPPPTAQQQSRRQQFAKAVSLARVAISNEAEKEFFKSIAQKGQSAYHAALSYFLKNEGVEIKDINPSINRKEERTKFVKSLRAHIDYPILIVIAKKFGRGRFKKGVYLDWGVP